MQAAPQSGEQELESLVLKLSVLKDFLSSIEKKVSTARGTAVLWGGGGCGVGVAVGWGWLWGG